VKPKLEQAATARFARGTDRRTQARQVAADRRRGPRRDPDYLRWITLFRDVDHSELSAALLGCEVLLLPAGAPLLRQGERNSSMYILLSGRLVAQIGEDASPENVVEISPGECVGELSAIDGKPISTMVQATSAARVLRLDRDLFWGRVMNMPGVGENLMTTLTERMRRANEKAMALLRERLELKHLQKELDVARRLQASMLPLQRPLFPGRTDIEACGFMEPAASVGGDLFDAFFVDGRKLFICIGDVSGHGIVAALFMVRVISLLRSLAMEMAQPDRILETLNDRLRAGNDTNLFVTLFCGFLDVETGELVYSNGGHCAPMLSGSGGTTLLPLPKGIVVGVAGGRRYTSLTRRLEAGETLFCYTDGVTEMESRAGKQFAEQGCIEVLREHAAAPLPELLDSLYARVVGHGGSQALTDDCAMLAVRLPSKSS
jgi:sigma-B regulation protein RsbU (phosphoserine phosphatase)